MGKSREKKEDFEELYISPDEPIYTTGVVCRILEIPVWVLKQLDNEEIVRPVRKNQGQARLYSKRELKLVKHCWYYMKIHNVKISGLKIILQMEDGTFKEV